MTAVPLSDEELLERAGRDTEALAALYDRYGRLAYGLALRVLRDPGLAEDAVQEAFVALRRSAPTFDRVRGAARTWLLTLVHRRSVDLVRRQERQRALGVRHEEIPPASAEEDAFERLEREQVRAALRRLTPLQREVLELAYYGGFTQSEIAASLEVPLGTVKTRTLAALTRLHTLLAADEDERAGSG